MNLNTNWFGVLTVCERNAHLVYYIIFDDFIQPLSWYHLWCTFRPRTYHHSSQPHFAQLSEILVFNVRQLRYLFGLPTVLIRVSPMSLCRRKVRLAYWIILVSLVISFFWPFNLPICHINKITEQDIHNLLTNSYLYFPRCTHNTCIWLWYFNQIVIYSPYKSDVSLVF